MINATERKRSMDAALQSRELWMTVLESTLASAIAIPALIGNILLCLAIYRFRALRKIQYYYIFTLAVSDFLLTLLFISLSFAVPILGRWPFDEAVCKCSVSILTNWPALFARAETEMSSLLFLFPMLF